MNNLLRCLTVMVVVLMCVVILQAYDNYEQWSTIEEMAEHIVQSHTAIDDRLKALEE